MITFTPKKLTSSKFSIDKASLAKIEKSGLKIKENKKE